jgi:hypothetical protein
MPINDTTNSDELIMLTSALDEFCSAQDIERFTPHHEHAAMLVMTLFNNGAKTPEAIVTALTDWTRWTAARAAACHGVPAGGPH